MFGISAMNPWLLWGTLAVASPILIHLLSKRKYKVINWAAMDFLLEADRRNRRRIRLEHLILLLLRCLAVILIALLVARPFVQPTGMAAAFAPGQAEFERILILDDSPSMQAKRENETSFEQAKEQVINFAKMLSRERPTDTVTVLVTSRPERPLIKGKPLSKNTVTELISRLQGTGEDEGLQVSDVSTDVPSVLSSVRNDLLEADRGHPNKVVYLLTDFRSREWQAGEGEKLSASAAGAVQELFGPERAQEVYLVDVGGEDRHNLAVTGISTPEKALVQHRLSRFDVQVRNFGPRESQNVKLSFTYGESTHTEMIGSIPPGATTTVPVSIRFREAGPQRVRAEIESADQVQSDNVNYYAANVQEGIRVLLVDGHSYMSMPGQDRYSETYFLRAALDPRGPRRSGNVIERVTQDEFEGMSPATLRDYQVIYLCNVGEPYGQVDSDEQRKQRLGELENWVRAGGGLVVFLGDRVRADLYNEFLHRDGEGLLPLRLEEERGDPEAREAVKFVVQSPNHPVLRTAKEGQLPAMEEFVRVWQYWHTTLPKDKAGASVLVTYNNPDRSPAIAEQVFGQGRVLMATTTADDLWTDWPNYGDYVALLQEGTYFVARSAVSRRNLTIGGQIREQLDLSEYMQGVSLAPPRGEAVPRTADTDTQTGVTTFSFGEADDERVRLDQSGFYGVQLKRISGDEELHLYAVNVDATESDLARAEKEVFLRQFGEDAPQFLDAVSLGGDDEIGRSEYAMWLLYAAMAVLALELFLGWSFGRRR